MGTEIGAHGGGKRGDFVLSLGKREQLSWQHMVTFRSDSREPEKANRQLFRARVTLEKRADGFFELVGT